MVNSRTKPVLCYVTERKSLNAADPVRAIAGTIQTAAKSGADWVQIREKDLPSRLLLDLVRGAVASVPRNTQIIVNDRLDVAIAVSAAGVHLGRESLPLADVIRWCKSGHTPADFLIGVSCHNIAEARAAEADGASYIIFGPVFDTPSKRSFGPPQGIERLREVSQAVHIPVIAIGGIAQENARECARAGATGIAAIRLFQDETKEDVLAERLARLRAEFSSAGAGKPSRSASDQPVAILPRDRKPL
jgi:thiamine-phosphate pyrophosphorylase